MNFPTKHAEGLLELALMASARGAFHEALTYVERAKDIYLSIALAEEHAQIKREIAMSDLHMLRSNGL